MKISQAFPELAPAPISLPVMIITRDNAVATERAKQLEAEALAMADAVTQVTNSQENQLAVEAQASLAKYIRAVQNAEEQAKKPLNQLRSKIIQLGKDLIQAADSQGNRIGKLVADFQRLERDRAAAARRLQDEQARALELEKDKKLLNATSCAEQDAIRDEYREQIATVTPPPEPVRASGQVLRDDWSITVVDIWLLARAMPSCVKIEARPSEIKALLNAGVKVPGILAEKVTKATVRIEKEPEAIEV